jgi:hypothetical protein
MAVLIAGAAWGQSADKVEKQDPYKVDASKWLYKMKFNMMNLHGVEQDRLKVVGSGGVENMFYNDPNLSRAVIAQVIAGK